MRRARANLVMRRVASAVARATGRIRPGAARRPPGERSILDDIAIKRPWNLAVKAARARALVRLRALRLEDGVTVVIVNWNTRDVVADVLRTARRLSPPDTRILVVDNGSTDGSREMLRAWPGIQTMLLRANAGHGVALDLALCSVRTSVAVTLDSDAIPLREGWLDSTVDPVRTRVAVVAGGRSERGFVHPAYMAIDTEAFVRRGFSFQVHVEPGLASDEIRWGENAWDTAELMSLGLQDREIVLIDRTESAASELPGVTAGGVVYHHGGMSRSTDGGLTGDAVAGWRDACRALGLDP